LDPIFNIPIVTSLKCANCSSALQVNEKFCGYCGLEVAVEEVVVKEDAFTVIKPTLIYYFATLFLLSLYKLTTLFPDGIEGLTIVSTIDIVITIGLWAYFFDNLKPLFSLRTLVLKLVLITLAGACVSAIIVSYVADLINISLFDDGYYSPYLYQDTSRPLLWAIIMTCVQPAIFEEVAFRGFIFTNLQVLSSPKGAVYISAILFGIMHLAFISLLWLIPLGIAFAMLRMKYKTLWYGIIGHFTYNFTIIFLEFYW
jgi:membrane protease YdiL (CAAX protease family)